MCWPMYFSAFDKCITVKKKTLKKSFYRKMEIEKKVAINMDQFISVVLGTQTKGL